MSVRHLFLVRSAGGRSLHPMTRIFCFNASSPRSALLHAPNLMPPLFEMTAPLFEWWFAIDRVLAVYVGYAIAVQKLRELQFVLPLFELVTLTFPPRADNSIVMPNTDAPPAALQPPMAPWCQICAVERAGCHQWWCHFVCKCGSVVIEWPYTDKKLQLYFSMTAIQFEPNSKAILLL